MTLSLLNDHQQTPQPRDACVARKGMGNDDLEGGVTGGASMSS